MIKKLLYEFGIEIKKTIPRPMIKFIEKNLNGQLTGVEIGVFRGHNTENILKKLNINKLYLVDPYVSYRDGGGNPYKSLNEAEKETRRKIKKYEDRVILIKKKSS